jgi:hypothetical protein
MISGNVQWILSLSIFMTSRPQVHAMKNWTERYQDWEGTAAELADVAAAVAAEIRISDGDAQKGSDDKRDNRGDTWRPNERLVRHYVQVGILGRPERAGKEAHFRFRQIVELLATRVLLNDGWPLAKIADFVRLTGDDGLLALLLGSAPLTPAQELVGRFKRGAFSEEGAAFRHAPPASPQSRRALPPVDPMRRTVDHLRRRREAFPDGTPPKVENWLRIELAPWCHVFIERDTAQHTPPETVEQLSRLLAQAVIDFIRRGDRK